MNTIKDITTEAECQFNNFHISDKMLAQNNCTNALLLKKDVKWAEIIDILVENKNTRLLEYIVQYKGIVLSDSQICLSGSMDLFEFVENPASQALNIVIGGNDDIIDFITHLPDTIFILMTKHCTVAKVLRIYSYESIPSEVFYEWCIKLDREDIIYDMIQKYNDENDRNANNAINILHYVLRGDIKICSLELYKECCEIYKNIYTCNSPYNVIIDSIIEGNVKVAYYLIDKNYDYHPQQMLNYLLGLNIYQIRFIFDKIKLYEIYSTTISNSMKYIKDIDVITYIDNVCNISSNSYTNILGEYLYCDNYICAKYVIDKLGINA